MIEVMSRYSSVLKDHELAHQVLSVLKARVTVYQTVFTTKYDAT